MLIYKKYTKCETSIGEHKEENGENLSESRRLVRDGRENRNTPLEAVF